MSSLSHGSAKGSDNPSRRQRIRNRLQKVGQTVQRFNLAKLIADMERDQELADQLENVNEDVSEEMHRKDLVREAIARCHQEIESHIDSFLISHPHATYESWIQDLHPENVQQGKILEDLFVIDPRFYVESSDHRKLWNDRVPNKQVLARSYKPLNFMDGPVDLLDDTEEVLENVDLSHAEERAN
jgi:hypothetical protein